MIALLMGAVIIAAVIAVGVRRWQSGRAAGRHPGHTLERAIVVNRFDEIDAAVQYRRCAYCGGTQHEVGETSRTVGERRFRIVRLVCDECERDERVHFDVTEIFH